MSKEIKTKIDELNEQLETLIVPGTFVLSKKVKNIQDCITNLQGQCKHNFINGVCEFCYKEDK